MRFTLLEQHKLLFKRWLVSDEEQLECQGRSALLSALDKTANFLLFRKWVGYIIAITTVYAVQVK